MLETRQRRGRTIRSDHRWALLISQRYSLSLDEARAELRRLAAAGWQLWEFRARFANACKDDAE
ncbi:hypothetical protein AB0N17_03550 [Streptomyces sp. NPDC051133]|uniref:hypothetical protein n=1 Tax=Streptomyces sp. NPDC051133 TaxID=3155521 RepID=UPI0034297EFA